jgi:hypothetical protein
MGTVAAQSSCGICYENVMSVDWYDDVHRMDCGGLFFL